MKNASISDGLFTLQLYFTIEIATNQFTKRLLGGQNKENFQRK
ncbi:MAG: hypothetical protein WBK46_04775 [Ruminococcus flavefaciens]